MSSGGPPDGAAARLLHVVVGHGLPVYYLNCLRALRSVAPADDILVVDVASPQVELRAELERFAASDPRTELRVLGANDTGRNGKVGSLYDAYTLAFDEAIDRGFELVHLVQADFQVLWWDDEVVARGVELFERHPRCVNLYTALLSSDRLLGGVFGASEVDGTPTLRHYGVTDTGLYHLGRWRELGLEFGDDESVHARVAREAGLEVVCHPWPTDAPIPWPAVVRGGSIRGREVPLVEPYLLRPLGADEIAAVKEPGRATFLEDVCVPWGWVCLAPMWTTGIDSVDYWAARYHDARRNGLRHALPRPVTRGVDWRALARHPARVSMRPPLRELLLAAPAREVARRARERRVLRGQAG